MPTRIVMIHQGPSDECACPWCHIDDGTAWREDGTPKGGAIAGLCFALAFLLVVGIVLVIVGSAS